MLVIRRRAGESLFIGEDVEIEVLEIAGSQVKLGIRAPREVPILRAEIRVTAEQNRAASQLAPESAIDNLRDRLKGQARKSIQREREGLE
jgi:carbon storage regulator